MTLDSAGDQLTHDIGLRGQLGSDIELNDQLTRDIGRRDLLSSYLFSVYNWFGFATEFGTIYSFPPCIKIAGCHVLTAARDPTCNLEVGLHKTAGHHLL